MTPTKKDQTRIFNPLQAWSDDSEGNYRVLNSSKTKVKTMQIYGSFFGRIEDKKNCF